MGATLFSCNHNALREFLVEWGEQKESPALAAEAAKVPVVDFTAPGGAWEGDTDAIAGKWSIRKVRDSAQLCCRQYIGLRLKCTRGRVLPPCHTSAAPRVHYEQSLGAHDRYV